MPRPAGRVPPIPGAANPNAAKDKEGNEFSHAITLPTDNRHKKRLEAAVDYMKEAAWGKASQVLQSLLDIKEDVFVQVTRKDNNGKETYPWVSVRAEANRILGTMPQEGLEFYRLSYRNEARKLLAEAKANHDISQVALVAKRYLYTESGVEAITYLGSYLLDRGENVMAALCFERLLERETLTNSLR